LQEGIRMLENENYKGALDHFNGIAKKRSKERDHLLLHR
jgi:hypothetical protein